MKICGSSCWETGDENVRDTSPAGDAADMPLRFERREADRWPLHGAASVVEVGGERFGRTHGLRLADYADGGVGGVVETPLPPGTAVSVGFRSPGYPARRGVVVRCLPCGDGYRLAIRFDRRLAA